MSYIYLSTFERGQLECLRRLGWSTRAISKELGRHYSTIARELKRNSIKKAYHSEDAQNQYTHRRQECKQKES